MAVREILTYPDEGLKQLSREVKTFDQGLRALVQDLVDTMNAGPGGVGIAAPQLGYLERIVIVDVSGKPNIPSSGRIVLVNPEIKSWEGMDIGREGCLSVPDYTGNVIRAQKIRVYARDEYGVSIEINCTGFEARAIQHEIDHLDGLLFLDRLVSRRYDLFRRKKRSQ